MYVLFFARCITSLFFFFNDTATTEIYTLSLHDALPIWGDIVLTDIKTAEMSKVVENTYRDINIAFANELAKICRQDDMDVYEIINIANKHPRVNILSPGPGVGGHCISVDPWFLVGDYPDIAKLIGSARQVNDSMPRFVFERLKKIMKDNEVVDMSRVEIGRAHV